MGIKLHARHKITRHKINKYKNCSCNINSPAPNPDPSRWKLLEQNKNLHTRGKKWKKVIIDPKKKVVRFFSFH